MARSYRVLQTMYLKVIKKFKPRKIEISRKSLYKQTAGNCWIYSVMNNWYLNLSINVDEEKFIEYMKLYGLDTDRGNDYKISWPIFCNYFQEHSLRFYELDVLEDTKLFAKLLKAWYCFVYTRDCHDSVLRDIRDDKEIDDIIKSRWAWHAVNLWFENGKLKEYGSWWENSPYNNFVYGTTDVFIKSVREWAISSKVYFLDVYQNPDDR
jgi:hypothetical protein